MEEDRKACPLCKEQIKKDALRCRFCGADLQAYYRLEDTKVERVLFDGHPPVVQSIVEYLWILLTLGIALIKYWFRSRSISYRITTHRILIDRGLFSKSQNAIELFRVDDFMVHRPFAMKILGLGSIQIVSSDRGEPDVILSGVEDPDALYEVLRKASADERERRGVKQFKDA